MSPVAVVVAAAQRSWAEIAGACSASAWPAGVVGTGSGTGSGTCSDIGSDRSVVVACTRPRACRWTRSPAAGSETANAAAA